MEVTGVLADAGHCPGTVGCFWGTKLYPTRTAFPPKNATPLEEEP